MIKNLSLLKKLIIVTVLLLIFVNGFISGVNAQTFTITNFMPEDICDTCAQIKADVDNPDDRELDISIFYKKQDENEFKNKSVIQGVTSSTYEIDYVLTNLTAGTTYEYYFQAEQIGGDRDVYDSQTLSFETTGASSMLELDLDDDFNKYLVILFILAGIFFIVFTSLRFVGSLIILITGIILLFSSANVIMSMVIIGGGFTALFLS